MLMHETRVCAKTELLGGPSDLPTSAEKLRDGLLVH